MESETLKNLRTMRQVKTSLGTTRLNRVRTSNFLFGSGNSDVEPVNTADVTLRKVLTRERARMAAYQASIEKTQDRILEMRKKLAAVIKRNQALTELRHELQQARWQDKNPTPSTPTPSAPPAARNKFNELEVRY